MPTPSPASRPIRVAHLIQNLNYGGMERVLHSLARALPNEGFEVHVVVLEYYGRFAEGLGSAETLHQVPRMSRLSLLRPGRLITVLRELAPDIVHTHSGLWLKGVRAARMAGVPVVVHTEHGRPDPVPLINRVIDNRASRLTDAVIAVSEALGEVLRQQVVHHPTRVRVIVNGVDTDRLRPHSLPSSVRAQIGVPDDAPVIGSVGRLEPIKNYALAIRALAGLPGPFAAGRAPYLILVGDGSERRELELLASGLGVAERVRFLGWRDDAEQLYHAFDIFTMTSRSEGTSISLLEAMAAGTCPIVTDVGGNRAVLGPALDSLLVPDNSEAALTRAWRFHLENPDITAALAQQARLRVEKSFSLARMAEQHATLYRELLGARPQPNLNRPQAGTAGTSELTASS